jgi:ParB family chromosome partitioning protein
MTAEEGDETAATKAESSGSSLKSIPIDLVDPNPYQPRTHFDPAGLEELAASIKEQGVLQPVIAAPVGERFQLIAGERRFRASQMAGLSLIPAVVVEASPSEMAMIALVENLQRRDLNAVEEAEGFKRLCEEFQLTQEELAKRLGKSQAAVANKMRLLKLPSQVRESISREIITERHARALLSLGGEKAQIAALEEVVRRGLTVRETESLVKGMCEKAAPSVKSGEKAGRRVVRVFKDCRLFRNSLVGLVREMEKGGAQVQLEETMEADFYEATVRVFKKAGSE